MSDLTGELIDGRYQLIRQMATGGMASIYEALDTRLDRKVAVKIMHSHLAQDEQFVERFIREAKAAAALSHPNIVAVQDQGWNQNGSPAIFLVMEMIEGHTLREYLNEQGKLSVADGIKFLLPVLSALSAAHKIGIVHRDIKPENILISRRGASRLQTLVLQRALSSVALSPLNPASFLAASPTSPLSKSNVVLQILVAITTHLELPPLKSSQVRSHLKAINQFKLPICMSITACQESALFCQVFQNNSMI